MDKVKLAELRKKAAENKAKKHSDLLESNASIKDAIQALSDKFENQSFNASEFANQLTALKDSITFKDDIERLENALKEAINKPVQIENLADLLKEIGDRDSQKVYDAVQSIVEKIEDNKVGSQRPEDFMPFRRVLKIGGKFVFDDAPMQVSVTGGAGVQQNLIENDRVKVDLGGTPVTIQGDVIVDGVKLEDEAGNQINPATEEGQEDIVQAINDLPAPQTNGLTDDELRATPVPVNTGLTQGLTDAQLRATPVPVEIDGDVIVDNVGLENANGDQINPATEEKQTSGNASLSSIDTKLSSQSTAANQTTGNASLSSIDTKLSSQATAANQTAGNTLIGAVTETAPASDTASSGLNGRLQRIAQRLTSLIGLLPGSLGQKARAASLAVTLSSEDVTALTPPAAITGFATSANQTTELTRLGDVTETAPASDTASSGLNGRLQRIAQRLTSLIGLLPGSLGQKARAASLAVTLSTEDITTLTPPAAITGFATAANQTAEQTLLGAITETAPANDTASSGLNGRLQRIAQRLTSLIALLPASLGQKARSASLAVTLSSEDITALTPGSIPAGTNNIGRVGTISQALNNGQQTVNTTAVQISNVSTVPTNGILIGALSTNTDPIFIGGSGVTVNNGIELLPGASLPFTCNLNELYIRSAVSTTDKIWYNVT